jgi:hypothetical protein
VNRSPAGYRPSKVKLERALPPGTRNIAYQRSMGPGPGVGVATDNARPSFWCRGAQIHARSGGWPEGSGEPTSYGP